MASNDGTSSYWSDSAPPLELASGTLERGERFDVVVVGAGFTGLWTAYHLLQRSPGLSIAVLDRAEVGFGASGRNGGFVSPKIGPFHQMIAPGPELGRTAYEAGVLALAGIRRVVAEEGIECEFRDAGLLSLATNEVQVRRITRELHAVEQLGIDSVSPLDRSAVAERIVSPHYLLGMREEHCAVVHPLRLVRGIAQAVARRGARIVERCGVTGYRARPGGVTVDTGRGPIEAEALVFGLNGWAPEQRPFHRDLVSAYNYAIATEPIDPKVMREIWPSGDGASDKRFYTQYYRPTADGRIVFGGRDAPTAYASRVVPERDRNERVFTELRDSIRWTFPQLRDVKVTHSWGGPIGVTPAFVPRVGKLREGPVHFGHGYNGQGVCASFAVASLIADAVHGDPSTATVPYYATHDQGRFPPEPFRSLGAFLIRREMLRRDRRGDEGDTVRRTGEPLLLRAGARMYGRTSRLASTPPVPTKEDAR